MSQSRFLKTALKAAKKAEAIILHYHKNLPKTEVKPDKTPVTKADKEAEQVIRQIIAGEFPDHGFIGEEYGKEQSKSSDFTWIIDPIDGTKNFVRGLPLFGSEIGLMKNKQMILGVSNTPAMGEILFAEKGQGAFRNNNEPIQVSGVGKLEDAYLSFGGLEYFSRVNKTQELIKLIQSTQGHRGFGDAWSYHLLATGKIDIMMEASTKIWDIAALALIVEEAGGTVTNLQGKDYVADKTTILATNGKLHQSVLDMFNLK